MDKNNKKLEEIEKSIWSFFINKRPAAILILISIIIIGIFSINSIPRELQPEVNIPLGIVSTILPGANPLDVETLITKPLEQGISTISNIKSMSSSSNFGVSMIMIEFEASADIKTSIQDLKDAVDLAKIKLPKDANDPTVSKAEANSYPIISFSLLGNVSISELTEAAKIVQTELEKIQGVSKVDLIGGQEKEIEVLINREKAEKFGLSIETIGNIIAAANLNVPIGTTQIDKINYSLRISNPIKNLQDIQNITLLTIPNETKTSIFLKDIAVIQEKYPIQSTISRFSIKGAESKQSVSLSVNKKNNGNIIQIAENTYNKISELQDSEKIPKNIEFAASNDNSYFIKTDLNILTTNGIQTTILITIILFLALGFMEGLIAGLSIPLSFLIAFTIMYYTGMTINSLSLFSLVIALGLMVDTSIVIMEGISENLKKGYNSKQATMLAIDTYKYALIAGTLTTIFAFFPMLLISGILGEFLRTLPITISATLFASLFISLTISPSLATKFLKNRQNKKSILESTFNKIGKKFSKLINKVLSKKIYRVLTMLITIILFLLSLSLPLTGTLKAEMFPQTDGQYFYVDIEIPKGIIIEETDKITKEVEEYLYTIPEIETFLTSVGQSSTDLNIGSQGSSKNSNIANITINLVDESERERRSYEIAAEIRKEFKYYSKAKVTVKEIAEGPPSESPITIRITGPEIEELQKISSDIKNELEQIPNTSNVRDTFTKGLSEFVFTLNREKISKYGLNANMIAMNIRNLIQGIKADEITINGNDLNINLRYDFKQNEFNKTEISINDIQNFTFKNPEGKLISLSEIADFKFDESLSTISHEDEERIVKVISDVSKEGNTTEITNTIQEKLKNYELKDGYEISFGGDLEQINESFKELFMSMIIGIILILFTLVLMFNSFKQPIIILFTLPLALIGVFPGLALINLNLSFPAFLGIVALTGIVVNDAIVLIDRINENRRNNIEIKQSISEAANSRLQPIIMTSITTVVGILPLALTNEFWSGLGFTLIFGLICSTGLTLIIIPVFYYLLEAKKS